MTFPHTKVLVIGASGSTGRQVIYELKTRNISYRIFVRQAHQASPGEDFVEGDALSSDLGSAYAGITAVISTLGSKEPDGLKLVDLPATRRLVDAAIAAKISRFVLCSTIGAVATPGIPEHLLKAFAPKGEAEQYLRESGLPYTIIRPGRLYDEAGEDPRGIHRALVARALVESLSRSDSLNRIYELNQARLKHPDADAILGLQV